MGSLRDISAQQNIQTFPGATFAITGEVPGNQCAEAILEGIVGETAPFSDQLTENEAFRGHDLTGKKITITSPPTNVGTYNIIFNTDDIVTIDDDLFSSSNGNIWFCHNSGELRITRNASSFLRFLQTFDVLHDFPDSSIFDGDPFITNVGAFTQDFTGLQVTLLALPQPYFGPHLILSNTIDHLVVDLVFDVTSGGIDARITDPNAAAATIKGGILYTSMPSERLRQACSIVFDPQS